MAGPISNVKHLYERQASVVRGSLVEVGPPTTGKSIMGNHPGLLGFGQIWCPI